MTTCCNTTSWFLGFCVCATGILAFDTLAWAVPPVEVLSNDPARWIDVADVSSASGDETSTATRTAPVSLVNAEAVGGDTCNLATVSPLSVPGLLTVFGDSTGVTGPDICGFDLGTIWWEAFEISECANVTLDLCGTDPIISPAWGALATECSPDGSSCGGVFGADNAERNTCVDANLTLVFNSLLPGIYYYPIISDAPGPYQMNITTTPSSSCPLLLGSCCVALSGTCTDGVAAENCAAPGQSFTLFGQCCELECRDPLGPEFDSSGVQLLSRVTLEDFAAFNGTPGDPHTGNEVWGYTSPSGREYALMGTTTGTGFVDLTDPMSPVIVAFINNGGVDTIWRDMDVFGQHAYVVTDGVGVGLQIIDLTNIDAGVVTFVKTTDLGLSFVDAHNVSVNASSGFLYLSIPNLNGGLGLTAVSLADPLNPVVVGTWTDTTPGVRCHDVQVVTYTSGPNAGREIAFCFAEDDGLKIVDVTNKASMFTVSTLAYPTRRYCHQGWATGDGQFVIFNDELDERDGFVSRTTTYVADVSNLSAPTLAGTFEFQSCNIDHNLMVRGDFVYEANYATGLRVLNFESRPNLTEFAHFDTHPEDNATDFEGTWGVFSDFASGNVIVSDRQRGLFVFANPEPPPPPPPIPTVSAWGLALMTLLLLAAATVAIRRFGVPAALDQRG